jgi:hypothetical protein
MILKIELYGSRVFLPDFDEAPHIGSRLKGARIQGLLPLWLCLGRTVQAKLRCGDGYGRSSE